MKPGHSNAANSPKPSDSTENKQTTSQEKTPQTIEEASLTARDHILCEIPQIVTALIDVAKNGNTAAAKYLFEEAGVKLQGPAVHEHKNCLATLLLSRLKEPLPPTPLPPHLAARTKVTKTG